MPDGDHRPRRETKYELRYGWGWGSVTRPRIGSRGSGRSTHYRAAVNSTARYISRFYCTDYAVLTHAASVILVNMEVYTLALLVEGLLDASACSALAV